ncbi:MAG: DUF5615 family PIN-like protein [Anaerolineae bacterium]|nr:DUF5615 family PIN-like protein [Anaerolineae bacterium]
MNTGKLFAGVYVDADLTPRVVNALRQRSYEAYSALEDGLDTATDEEILVRATALNMVVLTNNDRDFTYLAQQWMKSGRSHAGILISEQYRNRQFGEFLRRLLRFLDTVSADEMQDCVRYLSEFR